MLKFESAQIARYKRAIVRRDDTERRPLVSPVSRYRGTRFDPGLVGKWISLEVNVLAEEEFQAIEPLNLRACMRLRGLGNLVDQTGIEPVTS